MNEKLKKIMNISSKVLTWVLIAFTVCTVIFTLVTVLTVDKNERSIFGFRFYVVLSDSMSKSENNADMKVHFNAGDIVIIQNVKDPTSLKGGDIIAFVSGSNSLIEGTDIQKFGKTITHMIRNRVYNEKGELFYQTFGTNTGADDDELVDPSQVLGKYVGKLPGLGHFFAFLKTTPGYIVCILVPFLLLIMYNGGNVISLFRKYKKEQNEAIAAERKQIEDERAENQRMMAELLELKAQLMKNNGEATAPADNPAEEERSDAENAENDSAENTSDDKSDESV